MNDASEPVEAPADWHFVASNRRRTPRGWEALRSGAFPRFSLPSTRRNYSPEPGVRYAPRLRVRGTGRASQSRASRSWHQDHWPAVSYGMRRRRRRPFHARRLVRSPQPLSISLFDEPRPANAFLLANRFCNTGFLATKLAKVAVRLAPLRRQSNGWANFVVSVMLWVEA